MHVVRRRERRRSPLPILLAGLLAMSVVYMLVVVFRIRRHSAAVDTRVEAVHVAAEAEAELSREIEGFEEQHEVWAKAGSGRVASAGSGYRPLRPKRRGRLAGAAALDTAATAPLPASQADATDALASAVGSSDCSSDPGQGCMPSPAVLVMSHDRADMLTRSLGQLCAMRMHRQFSIYVSEDTGRPELVKTDPADLAFLVMGSDNGCSPSPCRLCRSTRSGHIDL